MVLLEKQERSVVRQAIKDCYLNLDDFDFEVRTAFSRDEILELDGIIDVKQTFDKESVKIMVSALNEACNGFGSFEGNLLQEGLSLLSRLVSFLTE